MGHKTNPIGFRLGLIRDWESRWYANKSFGSLLVEDYRIRKAIEKNYPDAGISTVEIVRLANDISVTVHTARPGVVIGRSGQRVDEMRSLLESLTGKKVKLNIREIQQPEMDAFLVARNIAEQIEHQVSYRRAMKQSVFRTMQGGAGGIKIKCSGRIGGAEIARDEAIQQGRVPLHTLRANIDYGITAAHTAMGCIGIKVWIYKGDILREVVSEAAATETVAAAPTKVGAAAQSEAIHNEVATNPATVEENKDATAQAS